MHIFVQILIIYGALLFIGALIVARFIRTAEEYPCENCGRNPATRELLNGWQLCESCYLAREKDAGPPDPSSENPEDQANEDQSVDGLLFAHESRISAPNSSK